MRVSYPYVKWTFDHVVLPNHITNWNHYISNNTLYIRYYGTYDHKTWQGGDSPWETPIAPWNLYHVVLLDHVTNQKHIYYYNP